MKNNRGSLRGVFLIGELLVAAALLSGCGGSAIHVGDVAIEPRSVTLSPGQTQVFAGSTVDGYLGNSVWSVVEGERGGSITDIPNSQELLSRPTAVTYTAPMTLGTYHVRLGPHSQSYGGSSAKATIQVR